MTTFEVMTSENEGMASSWRYIWSQHVVLWQEELKALLLDGNELGHDMWCCEVRMMAWHPFKDEFSHDMLCREVRMMAWHLFGDKLGHKMSFRDLYGRRWRGWLGPWALSTTTFWVWNWSQHGMSWRTVVEPLINEVVWWALGQLGFGSRHVISWQDLVGFEPSIENKLR